MFEGIDDATLTMMLQLQLQDTIELLLDAQTSDDQVTSTSSSWVETLKLQNIDLRRELTAIQDRKVAFTFA